MPYGKKTYGGWPGDPSWIVAPAIIAWETWKRSGDSNGLQKSFSAAKAVVDFLSDHTDPATGLISYGYYGDWLAIEATPKAQVTSFSHILAISRVADMARALDDPEAEQYADLRDTLTQLWHRLYYNTTSRSYGASQTANILALYLGAPAAGNVSAAEVADILAGKIEQRNMSLTSGALGSRYVSRGVRCGGVQYGGGLGVGGEGGGVYPFFLLLFSPLPSSVLSPLLSSPLLFSPLLPSAVPSPTSRAGGMRCDEIVGEEESACAAG